MLRSKVYTDLAPKRALGSILFRKLPSLFLAAPLALVRPLKRCLSSSEKEKSITNTQTRTHSELQFAHGQLSPNYINESPD